MASDSVDHGAHVTVDQRVDRVVIDPTTHQATRVVLAGNDGPPIRARRVVVSAGTLHSPGILQRSGLVNPHLGTHLLVHPCVATYGCFDHLIDTHHGTMMTAYTDVVADLDGDHYGAKIEGVSHHPGMMANAKIIATPPETNNDPDLDHRAFLFSDLPRQAPVVSTHEWGEWFLYEDHACLQTKPPPTFLQLTPDDTDDQDTCARCSSSSNTSK
ncbi:hypothetical protein BCR42DRAFT_456507 [Absidia repens]|uniref:Glucose-methanol-choline oxidoreductase N-terminal domain-containing protein n=1 Tax=Absidia repens TaxID=90262 RepID=A0A1X2HZS4_9FUNG|nr:hypothetical protein BCR42DRAFT_456507 [Absidia repens]